MPSIVKVVLDKHSYQIHIGQRLLEQTGGLLRQSGLRGRMLIVSNKKIYRLYGEKLRASLAAEYTAHTYLIGDGEKYKSLRTVERLLRFLCENKYERQDTLIALGGGVVGDLTGFAAAVYLRGVNYVQIPTTLLAQVDSSVGGKTAVNAPAGKNLIGAFYQPRLVIADTQTLNTLPRQEIISGLGEIIKYGLIAEPAILAALEKHQSFAPDLLARCCRIKARIVSADEKEKGLRAILNFGHTIGHALETISHYRLRHGQAVALGALAAAHISVMRGYLQPDIVSRLSKLYLQLQLPVHSGLRLNPAKICRIIQNDKKVSAGQARMVLLKGIGKPIVCPVEYAEIVTALDII